MTTIVNATSAVEMHVAASENISKGPCHNRSVFTKSTQSN
uniref:Uncharacterized protein n=1 Tax=Anguilla anguilla TaxID=7936 RepID=A0A0E9TNL0_ANGAN